MTRNEGVYKKRPMIFADGAKGLRLQKWRVILWMPDASEICTGIIETHRLAHHGAEWTVKIERGDREFATMEEAVADFRAEMTAIEGASHAVRTNH
jgi:hypothetical protein